MHIGKITLPADPVAVAPWNPADVNDGFAVALFSVKR
jgi:hypothetical protein